MVSDKDQKDSIYLFNYERSELNQGQPFDEESKRQGDELSGWLSLALR